MSRRTMPQRINGARDAFAEYLLAEIELALAKEAGSRPLLLFVCEDLHIPYRSSLSKSSKLRTYYSMNTRHHEVYFTIPELDAIANYFASKIIFDAKERTWVPLDQPQRNESMKGVSK